MQLMHFPIGQVFANAAEVCYPRSSKPLKPCTQSSFRQVQSALQSTMVLTSPALGMFHTPPVITIVAFPNSVSRDC